MTSLHNTFNHMKKIIFGLIATVLVSVSSFGQGSFRDIKSSEELQSIIDYVRKKGDFQKDYNFQNIKAIYQKENPNVEIIVINKKDFNQNNQTNSALTIFYKNRTFGEVFILKTTQKDRTNLISEYFDLDNKLLFSAALNTALKNVTVTYSTNSTGGCGQATIDCIHDAYSNHGWISVWTWVQTAFIPQTAAGIAIMCAGLNCL